MASVDLFFPEHFLSDEVHALIPPGLRVRTSLAAYTHRSPPTAQTARVNGLPPWPPPRPFRTDRGDRSRRAGVDRSVQCHARSTPHILSYRHP